MSRRRPIPCPCSYDGYVSQNAFGYRLRAGLALPGRHARASTLIPSVFFGQDVSGWSGGRRDPRRPDARDRLAAGRLSPGAGAAAIAWQPTWGGTYNNLRDRSTAQAYVGYQF